MKANSIILFIGLTLLISQVLACNHNVCNYCVAACSFSPDPDSCKALCLASSNCCSGCTSCSVVEENKEEGMCCGACIDGQISGCGCQCSGPAYGCCFDKPSVEDHPASKRLLPSVAVESTVKHDFSQVDLCPSYAANKIPVEDKICFSRNSTATHAVGCSYGCDFCGDTCYHAGYPWACCDGEQCCCLREYSPCAVTHTCLNNYC